MVFSVGIEHPHIVDGTVTGGKITPSWAVARLTDCDHPVTRRHVCHKVSCVQGCGADCHVHQHCENCGGTRCHGYWWRFHVKRLVEMSHVDRVPDEGRHPVLPFPFLHGGVSRVRPERPEARHRLPSAE